MVLRAISGDNINFTDKSDHGHSDSKITGNVSGTPYLQPSMNNI
jgi:hypothetical protein